MRAPLFAHRAVAISAAFIMAGALVGVASGVATASTCASWTGAQPANPSSSENQLSAVAVVTPCDVWAAGIQASSTANLTLTEHWNGAAWTVATSANPGGSSNNSTLAGVAVKSSTDAWAVGSYFNGTAYQTLIEALSGGSIWKQVSSANPGGPANLNLLQGVAITSATNAWAVGEYATTTQARTLIEHWNGAKWRQVTSPNVSATENGLSGVTAPSAKNAWAVGSYANPHGFLQTLIEHWNGTSWKRLSSPDPGGPAGNNSLAAVAANSASNAWAVGTYYSNGPHPLIAHWNGRRWRQVRLSVKALLTGVSIVSATDAWVVGFTNIGPGARTVIARWNGKTWARVLSPDLGSLDELAAIGASAAGNVWAVGGYNSGGIGLTLAVHCC